MKSCPIFVPETKPYIMNIKEIIRQDNERRVRERQQEAKEIRINKLFEFQSASNGVSPYVKMEDSNGDVFVTQYERYIDTRNVNADVTRSHLMQFCKNYGSAFGEYPGQKELDNSVEFMKSMLMEIGECYPNSRTSKAVSEILSLMGQDGLEFAENMALCAPLNERIAKSEGILLEKKDII
jgi:hypothetical protein